jgi:hypothetical protein
MDYPREENWVLREQLGGRRLLNELSTRKMEMAGFAAAAKGLWMIPPGRNLADAVDGTLRDVLVITKLLDMLADVGVTSVKLPPDTPNWNAHIENFVRT